jgi:hypothetical protein
VSTARGEPQACRRELLDRTLVWNQQHLPHTLREYEHFYNNHRPHQGIANARPLQPTTDQATVTRLDIHRRQRLGGILNGLKVELLGSTHCLSTWSINTHQGGWHFTALRLLRPCRHCLRQRLHEGGVGCAEAVKRANVGHDSTDAYHGPDPCVLLQVQAAPQLDEPGDRLVLIRAGPGLAPF